ncbi:MAG TPA: HAMP domain-containing sensor histidine kinase [Chloroflexota bacterium]|nr:HAMP domain-containing sensor histidine kinase [Chloroflexota bacterium]
MTNFGDENFLPELLHYYTSTLAGLLSVIIALLTRHGLGMSQNGRSVLLTFGFLALASLLLVSSVGVPYLLLTNMLHPAFVWSLFLSLPVSSLYFAAAGVRWTAVAEKRLLAWRWPLLGLNALIFLIYLGLVFYVAEPFALGSRQGPLLLTLTAVLGSALLIWAAWRSDRFSQWEKNSTDRNLAVTFILLAQAEICLAFGAPGSANWALFHLLLPAALLVTLLPLLRHAIQYQREKRQRSDLNQLIVHDLKSPLTIVISGLDLIHRGGLGEVNPMQARLLTNLEQCSDEILGLVNDMLDVERLEEGVMPLHKSMTDLASILREQVAELQILADKHQQQVQILTPETLPPVMVDPVLMRRVIHNLLANALKLTPDHGKIEVCGAVEGGQLHLSVADSGPGIPVADRQRIFDKFAQLDTKTRRGKGLGLTFCKMAVEVHGGLLTVEDSPLGGALFRLVLPLEGALQLTSPQPSFYRLMWGK